MYHLEESASIGMFVLVILLTPIRFWSGTATTSARLGHGRSGINVAGKEKHGSMGNILDSGGIIVLWHLNLYEENVLDRVRNLNYLTDNRCIDIERSEGRTRISVLPSTSYIYYNVEMRSK